MSADATPSAPEHLTFRAADGQRVAATRFPGRGVVRGNLLVAGAAAVPQGFYRAFAEHASARGYVQARGWDVTARFIEQGVSGAAQYRKVVDEILENARRRRFDAVVIFRGDRSFRTAGKGCLFINELISIGCAFLSVEGRYRHVDTRGRADGEDGDPDGRVGAQGDPGARARRHRRRSEQVLRWPVHVSEWMESAKEALEEETRRWAFLCPVEPVAASVAAPAVGLGEDGDIDPRRIPHRLDAELRGLVAMRDGWDELARHLERHVPPVVLLRQRKIHAHPHGGRGVEAAALHLRSTCLSRGLDNGTNHMPN